jgi:hypothetical protein
MSELIGTITEGVYQGKPLRIFKGTFNFPSNDPEFRDGQFLNKIFPCSVELAIHPNSSKKIIINIPGVNGDIDGYEDKYKKLAHYMQSNNLGAVVRTDNDFIAGYLPDFKLRASLQYVNDHAWEICGEPKPEVMLMGFSAGSSAIAAVAHEYPQVKRILLYTPSGDMPEQLVRDGLKKFKGDVYIVQGENDEIVGPEAGKLFHSLATGAKHKELIMIPNCGHQFKGETNGRIMSEAPFYAFTTGIKPKFPDPKGRIKLYD